MHVRFSTNGTIWGLVGKVLDGDLSAWREHLDDAAAAGYDGVEHNPGLVPGVSPATLREELERRGLALAGVLLYGAIEVPEGREAIEMQLRAAAPFVTELGWARTISMSSTRWMPMPSMGRHRRR